MVMLFELQTKLLNIKIKGIDNETSKAILRLCPFKAKIKTWGDEIYFSLPKNMKIALEDSSKDVFNLGEIAFWTEGNAIAIGFGKTPASQKNEIRLVSRCNYWANAINPEELLKLKKMMDGEEVNLILLKK